MRRSRAVGANEEASGDRAAVGELDIDVLGGVREFRNRHHPKLYAELARLGFQRVDEMAVLDHVGERLARLDLAGEGEKHRPHRVVEPAVSDDHVEDRLCLLFNALPNAQCLEQPARRRDDGRGAFVVGVA